jgi:hypothetical protein
LENTLTFSEDVKPVKDWYNRQSHQNSTLIKRMQLRTEYVAPYHQFIVVQTQGEPGCAYRLDRGREREGWSVFDTIKSLGVPSRDTIAVLQKPVEELDETSQCTIELHRSDDKTLDLWFILDICFRIHNNWATRYNLITHNCYFFARTIVNLCDDKLNKESSRLKRIWRRIFATAYRMSAVLIWSLLVCILALELPLTPLWEFVLGILLLPIRLLAGLQIAVAWAVQDMVAQVVKGEREQGGMLDLGPEWLERRMRRIVSIVSIVSPLVLLGLSLMVEVHLVALVALVALVVLVELVVLVVVVQMPLMGLKLTGLTLLGLMLGLEWLMLGLMLWAELVRMLQMQTQELENQMQGQTLQLQTQMLEVAGANAGAADASNDTVAAAATAAASATGAVV